MAWDRAPGVRRSTVPGHRESLWDQRQCQHPGSYDAADSPLLTGPVRKPSTVVVDWPVHLPQNKSPGRCPLDLNLGASFHRL